MERTPASSRLWIRKRLMLWHLNRPNVKPREEQNPLCAPRYLRNLRNKFGASKRGGNHKNLCSRKLNSCQTQDWTNRFVFPLQCRYDSEK